ncbi:MAG TPA: hypothetical protein VKV04_16840 [Verrucomicrobiae bacterium]|nr:hypothetical protein [Verrucomicrobiae bacterium]
MKIWRNEKNSTLSTSRLRAMLGEVGVQASPPAGSRTVSVPLSGGETPREPAAGSAAPPRLSTPRRAGFTIIEIALCLGIIAFALVAIIGALPTGLNVQKNNREQTIIGQDATTMMDAIRSGSMGFDDLTNYVVAITNFWTTYKYGTTPPQGTPLIGVAGAGNGTPLAGGGTVASVTASGADWYTLTNSNVPGFFMTSGATIIGLLTIPTWTIPFNTPMHSPPPSDYQSNYVVAYFRSMSGAMVDKVPQNNPTVLQDAFTYRLIVQNFAYAAVDTNGFCLDCPTTNALITSNQFVYRTNAAYSQWLLETNTHEFRLLFRWPVLPNGQIPNYGRYTFREMVDGQLTVSNFPNPPNFSPLYYVQPSIVYGQIQTTPGPFNQPQRFSPQ